MKLLTENYLRHFICSKFSVYNLLQRTVEHKRHKLHQKLQKYKISTNRKRKTSSARSATLENTSWAWLHLASWYLPDFQFGSTSKTEPKCSRHRTKWGGGTRVQWGGLVVDSGQNLEVSQKSLKCLWNWVKIAILFFIC